MATPGALHVGNRAVPTRLIVRAAKGGNKVTALPHGTSLLDIRAALPDAGDVREQDGLRLFSVPAALIACSPGFFANNPIDARSALATIRDASELLTGLLEGGHSTIAGRLAGAMRNTGRERVADDILGAMRGAGYTVRAQDPFADRTGFPPPRRETPFAGRVRLMWRHMRGAATEGFPAAPGRPADIDTFLGRVDDAFVSDAYHSLSIEGYRVGTSLLNRVRGGAWNPQANEQDREHRDALAARGYWLAFRSVRESLKRVLCGENPGIVADEDHGTWYRQLFAPGVEAGLLKFADLAGYRSGPVFIRRSKHVPPRAEEVRDAMPVLFELLAGEQEPAARVVLGHFVFAHIHPYTDGNGRISRFLMNVMLAAEGYPWTVVPFERRSAYMAALEEASVQQRIAPFAEFLAKLVTEELEGRSSARAPAD